MARQTRSAKQQKALSEEENSDFEAEVTVPLRRARNSTSTSAEADGNAPKSESSSVKPAKVDDDDSAADEDEEDEEDEEDVFVVEAIKKHMIDEDGTLKFHVKWEGYDDKKDMTWEPEENLQESAAEVLGDYFASIGGRERIFEETATALKTKKRGRPSSGTPSTTSKRSKRNGVHPADSTPPATAKKWSPPAGSWEDEISTIDACEDEGSGKLVVYLVWKNGQKTKHDTHVIYKKCPQKMLQFYERHVKIIREDNKAQAE